jgi:hypothetical protein
LAKPVEVRLNQLAVFEEDAGPLDRWRVSPGWESGVRRLDGGIDFIGSARGALGDDIAGRRIEDRRAGALRLQPFAGYLFGAGGEGRWHGDEKG